MLKVTNSPHLSDSQGYNIERYLANLFIWQGFNQILGPSIPDLSDSLGYSYEEISRCLALSNIAAIIGAFTGGVLNDFSPQRSEIFMSIFNVISSVAGLFFPMADPLYVLAIVCMINGLYIPVLQTGMLHVS